MAVPATYGVLALCFVASCVAWAGFNRLAIFALRTFGRQMRATIDLGVPSLVQLAEPWKPNDAQVAALRARKAYLQYGESPFATTSNAPAAASPATPGSTPGAGTTTGGAPGNQRA